MYFKVTSLTEFLFLENCASYQFVSASVFISIMPRRTSVHELYEYTNTPHFPTGYAYSVIN